VWDEIEAVQGLTNKMQKIETEVNLPILQVRKNVAAHRVYYIDKGLNIVPLKTIYHIGHLLIRKNRTDEGGEFIPGDSVANQALPGLIIRVEVDERVAGKDWIHDRQSQVCATGKHGRGKWNRWLVEGGV
jgi:hypothetical protein